MASKVIMFGGASSKYPLPPIEEGSERWCINNLCLTPDGALRTKHATHWFDLHHKEWIVSPRPQGRGSLGLWQRYQRSKIPVFMWQHHDDVPMSVAYEVDEIRAMFGGTRLFCSTLDWLLARALWKGFEEIDLYGWRMGQFNYMHQVHSADWWLKQCVDRGVKITHWSPTALQKIVRAVEFKPPRPDSTHLMYGLETTDRALLYHGR